MMASKVDDGNVPPQEVLAGYVREWFKQLRASANESGGSKGRKVLFFLRSLAYAPLDVLRRATIPASEPGRWNRFYAMTNVMFGPLLILHVARDVVPWEYPAVDLGRNTGYLPLWAAVLGASTVCAAALFAVTGYRAPPERWDLSLGRVRSVDPSVRPSVRPSVHALMLRSFVHVRICSYIFVHIHCVPGTL